MKVGRKKSGKGKAKDYRYENLSDGSKHPADAVSVKGESTRTVVNDNGTTSTEYVSDATVDGSAKTSRRVVTNKDGKSSSAYAVKQKPTDPVRVGANRPAVLSANFNDEGGLRSYGDIEREVRPGVSSAQALDDLEKAKKMMSKYKDGGMIKRKDGSYSPRGLWDNIRKNIGSGKKPTKAMLKAEKKIKGK